MDDGNFYYVKKDGRTKGGKDAPWLMAYQPSGCMELMANGKLQQAYTCLWGSRMDDAKPFEDKAVAQYFADRIGGCVVITVKGEILK